jgi:DMSO/TMAO reductase YedYZ molybdopterin-dependent catalytic subunit
MARTETDDGIEPRDDAQSPPDAATPEIGRLIERRSFLSKAAAGTVIAVLGGGLYRLVGDDVNRAARAERRSDGRPRLPPGQRVIRSLKPMGGQPGDPRPATFRLRVHGEVDKPFEVSFAELLEMPQTERQLDVHCVTGWSLLGVPWTGVSLEHLAKLAEPKRSARYVIFEAAHGYTANVPLRDALAPDVLVAHRFHGHPLAKKHGAPVRAVVPDLYFWKSAKWLTGLRFAEHDEPGYWERRGYHNHGDPWREQRYG